MLLTSPPRMIFGLGDVATSDDGLKKLQAALVDLANATHNAAINPGATDGVLVGGLPPDKTMAAISQSLGLINQALPTWAAVSLSIAFGVGASTATAKQAVLDYSADLTSAVKAATATAPYYASSPSATPDATSTTPTAPPPAWYTTWWGLGAIAVGALGLLSVIASHRAAPAAPAA